MKIDFIDYPNPDGHPFVRIYNFQREDAKILKHLFEQFANGSLQEAKFDDVCSVESVDGTKLKFVLDKRNQGVVKTDKQQFVLMLKEDGWLHIAGLTEVFCEHSYLNGFHWLTDFISNPKFELLLSPGGEW